MPQIRDLLRWIKDRAVGDPPTPGPAPPSTKTFPSGVKLLHSPVESTVDIVFIHGLTGDREKTWTAQDASEPWPQTLLPSKLPTARILTFGYDAYVTNWHSVVSQNRIGNHGWNLLTALASYRNEDNTNERPIIFVCHSLGGLVCEEALVKAKERSEPHLQNVLLSTRGIAFMGTPHHGAGLARWAELLSKTIGVRMQTNSRIMAVLKRDSEVLARIQDSFHTMVMARSREQPIEISCFYEELPLPGLDLVVPHDSAILPGYIPIGIHRDHMDMTKFSSIDDPGFKAVCGELRRWTTNIFGNPHRTPLQGPSDRQGLQERGQSWASGSSQPGRHPVSKQPAGSWFLVPYPKNDAFVGRTQVLQRLQQQPLESASQARVSLFGLGGTGKTQVALEYAYWLREAHTDMSVFWVHASNAHRFRESFSQIALGCRIPGSDHPKADLLLVVKKWLERSDRTGRWLMIIDNADDTQLFFPYSQEPNDTREVRQEGHHLAQYIPECAHGSILVTTRNKQAGSRLAKGKLPIEIGPMDDNEAEHILRAGLGDWEAEPGDLLTLSSRLGHLPLALVQAAAFIQENSSTVRDYLQLLNDQNLGDMLSEEFETVERYSEMPDAVTATWIVSFKQIRRQNALAGELLSLMSLLDRQAIPLEYLSHYSEEQNVETMSLEIQLTKALDILKAFSLIRENKDRSLDMHRLVQLVTRKWLVKEDKIQQFAEQAILTMSHIYPWGGDFENRAKCTAYLPHAHAVLELEGTGSGHEKFARSALLHCVAGLFVFEGRWKAAERFILGVLELRKEVLGEEHPHTLSSIVNLAFTFWEQGRWEEAELLEVYVLETREKTSG